MFCRSSKCDRKSVSSSSSSRRQPEVWLWAGSRRLLFRASPFLDRGCWRPESSRPSTSSETHRVRRSRRRRHSGHRSLGHLEFTNAVKCDTRSPPIGWTERNATSRRESHFTNVFEAKRQNIKQLTKQRLRHAPESLFPKLSTLSKSRLVKIR